MQDNPLKRLAACGQSPWLDFISRGLVRSGELGRLVAHWNLGGVTSNPTLFEAAIAHSPAYDADIRAAALAGRSAAAIYEQLVLDDVRGAADSLRDVHAASSALNGYVSVEVSPHLADDVEATVAEAARLWGAIDRPNAMIKVPGTKAGLAALIALTERGINVNMTLLFSLRRYREVLDAYFAGIELAARAGVRPERLASVASFFVSRIDTAVDSLLERVVAQGGSGADLARRLRGEIAIASARCAYEIFLEAAASQRYRSLPPGARMQRLLWASTGTKNPAYDERKYVEPLIGAGTVSTMLLATLEAYERHGAPAARLAEGGAAARQALQDLAEVGIDLAAVTEQLLQEGLRKFARSFDAAIGAIETRRRAALGEAA